MKILTLLSGAALALVLLSACGGSGQSKNTATSVDSGSANSRQASDFSISVYQGEDVLGGKEVQFSELLAQGKPVVLNMWAGLCPPCRAEMPDLQAVYDEYTDRVLLFGLDVGPFVGLGSREDGKALLEELNITYPNGTTFDGNVVRTYKILGMPTTYFIGPDGEIFKTWTGALNKNKLVELTEELLEVSTSS